MIVTIKINVGFFFTNSRYCYLETTIYNFLRRCFLYWTILIISGINVKINPLYNINQEYVFHGWLLPRSYGTMQMKYYMQPVYISNVASSVHFRPCVYQRKFYVIKLVNDLWQIGGFQELKYLQIFCYRLEHIFIKKNKTMTDLTFSHY